MPDIIDVDAAAALWGSALQTSPDDTLPPPDLPDHEYRYFRPLADAITEFRADAQAVNRIMTGVPEFDAEMRGISAGQLLTIIGHSHQGKTLLLTHILRYNRNKRMALVIPDEDRPLVLSKLAGIMSGVDARELEELIAQDDAGALALLRKVATEDFPYLAVFDGPQDALTMERSFQECTRAWGAPPELVMFDFLDQLQVGDAIMPKFDFMKAFGKRHNVPMIVLHQTSRSGGASGQQIEITSGGYGGESHATYMIGVRRKQAALMSEKKEVLKKHDRNPTDDTQADLDRINHDLRIHEYTVTVNLVKNKRVGGRKVEDIDMELEVGTGRLLPLGSGDLPKQYRQVLAAERPRPSFGRAAGTPTNWSQPALPDEEPF